MKRLLWPVVAAIVLLAIAVMLLARPLKTTRANRQEIFGVCMSQVPAEWGDYRGGSEQTGVAFQDRRGTLRFVTSFPCNGGTPPVALEIRRTLPPIN